MRISIMWYSLILPFASVMTLAAAQEALGPPAAQEAIALGKSCGDVPILRITKPDGDFVVFIESPFARIAVHAAAARQMHQPFDPVNITSDIGAPDYRVWLQYAPGGRRTLTANRVILQSISGAASGRMIQPTRDRRSQLTVGAIPAHGIITEVRWRGWEWTFDRLPKGEFEVVVETSASAQRYRVSSQDREGRMRVCT
jgi:hypothetical protein